MAETETRTRPEMTDQQGVSAAYGATVTAEYGKRDGLLGRKRERNSGTAGADAWPFAVHPDLIPQEDVVPETPSVAQTQRHFLDYLSFDLNPPDGVIVPFIQAMQEEHRRAQLEDGPVQPEQEQAAGGDETVAEAPHAETPENSGDVEPDEEVVPIQASTGFAQRFRRLLPHGIRLVDGRVVFGNEQGVQPSAPPEEPVRPQEPPAAPEPPSEPPDVPNSPVLAEPDDEAILSPYIGEEGERGIAAHGTETGVADIYAGFYDALSSEERQKLLERIQNTPELPAGDEETTHLLDTGTGEPEPEPEPEPELPVPGAIQADIDYMPGKKDGQPLPYNGLIFSLEARKGVTPELIDKDIVLSYAANFLKDIGITLHSENWYEEVYTRFEALQKVKSLKSLDIISSPLTQRGFFSGTAGIVAIEYILNTLEHSSERELTDELITETVAVVNRALASVNGTGAIGIVAIDGKNELHIGESGDNFVLLSDNPNMDERLDGETLLFTDIDSYYSFLATYPEFLVKYEESITNYISQGYREPIIRNRAIIEVGFPFISSLLKTSNQKEILAQFITKASSISGARAGQAIMIKVPSSSPNPQNPT